MGVELYKHNKTAYEQVQSMFKDKQKCCVVHATGTGKSFIALALVYDFLVENPESKVMLLAPLSGIGSQIKEHISTMDLPDGAFDNLQFNNYQSLITKTDEELKQMDFDLLVLDEFHHIGAPEWTKRLEYIIDANPEAKIFGMSATSVRSFGTKHEEDVAETFFEGNVASRYDLAQAIIDGTLPQPNYHCALAVLEGDCAELESKINNGGASPEEKQKYQKMLSDIRKRIAEGETSEEIIRNNIKGDGKYIYFCPKGSDLATLQDNIRSMLPPEYLENIEFYQVHSSEQTDKINELNSNNFYHNIAMDGTDAKGKLRIMFAIDMYNEGIHVPDIDGVIMGRATKSDITFYQQLGRALAVRKKSDGSDERIEPPLVIDLMGNLKEIKKLYNRVETRNNSSERDGKEHTPSNGNVRDSFDINFGLDEEIINLLDTLEELKSNVEFTLGFDERLKELHDYLIANGSLPKWDDKDTKFSDNRIMSNWLTQKRTKIVQEGLQGNEIAKIISEQFRTNPDEQFLLYLEEALEYCKKHGGFPNFDNTDSFSTGTIIYSWSKTYKDKINVFAVEGNEVAKKLIVYYAPTLDEAYELHINEMYEFIKANGSLPKKSLNLKFSDGKLMSAWLNKNKKKIAQSGLDGDERAQLITDFQQKSSKTQGKGIRTVERIVEILGYFDKNGKLPSDDIRFESGAVMADWLKAKSNKDAIQELIEQKNPEALRLVEVQNMFSSDSIFERRLSETYDYLTQHYKVPSTGEIKFSDGADMYSWILTYKQRLIERMQNQDEMAKTIIDKQYDGNIFSGTSEENYVTRVNELLEFYKINGRMPKSSDKIRFSDGSRLMFSWMKDNTEAIMRRGQTGDELSQVLYGLVYSSSDEGRFKIKCSELLKYCTSTGILPTKDEGRFSDESSMFHFVNNQAKQIYEYKDEDPVVGQLAEFLVSRKPNYFNKVEKYKSAEEEFNAESEFKKAKKGKGVKKANGK